MPTATTPVVAAAAPTAMFYIYSPTTSVGQQTPQIFLAILAATNLCGALAPSQWASRLAHFAQCCQSLPMLTRAAEHRGLKVTPPGALREVSRLRWRHRLSDRLPQADRAGHRGNGEYCFVEFATSCAAASQCCWPCRVPTCASSAPIRRLMPRKRRRRISRACSCFAVEPASPPGLVPRPLGEGVTRPERPFFERVPRALRVASLSSTYTCYISVLIYVRLSALWPLPLPCRRRQSVMLSQGSSCYPRRHKPHMSHLSCFAVDPPPCLLLWVEGVRTMASSIGQVGSAEGIASLTVDQLMTPHEHEQKHYPRARPWLVCSLSSLLARGRVQAWLRGDITSVQSRPYRSYASRPKSQSDSRCCWRCSRVVGDHWKVTQLVRDDFVNPDPKCVSVLCVDLRSAVERKHLVAKLSLSNPVLSWFQASSVVLDGNRLLLCV